jgi:uncharacterized membrane protein
VRENRTPGSVQGVSGNRCSCCDGKNMAIQEVVLGLIADTLNIVISGIAKLIGKSKSETKIVEKNIFWGLFIVFIFILIFVTFKYS